MNTRNLTLILLFILTACSAPPADPPVDQLLSQVISSVEPYRYDGPLSPIADPTEPGPLPLCEWLIPAPYQYAIDKDLENYCHVCTTWGAQDTCEEGMAVYLFRDYVEPESRLRGDVAGNPTCTLYEENPTREFNGWSGSFDDAYECQSENGLKQIYFARGYFYVELVARDDFSPGLVAQGIILNINRLLHSEYCTAYKLGICIIID